MTKEDAKDLTLSILVIAVALLAADCAWLHVTSARLTDRLSEQASAFDSLDARLEAHLNPPKVAESVEKTKGTFDQAKEATVRQYEKVKAAASAGYNAAKEAYNKGK